MVLFLVGVSCLEYALDTADCPVFGQLVFGPHGSILHRLFIDEGLIDVAGGRARLRDHLSGHVGVDNFLVRFQLEFSLLHEVHVTCFVDRCLECGFLHGLKFDLVPACDLFHVVLKGLGHTKPGKNARGCVFRRKRRVGLAVSPLSLVLDVILQSSLYERGGYFVHSEWLSILKGSLSHWPVLTNL